MDKMCAQLDYTLRLKSKTEMNRKTVQMRSEHRNECILYLIVKCYLYQYERVWETDGNWFISLGILLLLF